MNRSIPQPPQAAPPRTRTLASRPGRLTAAGLAIVTLTAALLLVWVGTAQASVWVIPAMGRAFPTTKPSRPSGRSPARQKARSLQRRR